MITCMIFLNICSGKPVRTPEPLTIVVFPNVTPNAERYDDKDSTELIRRLADDNLARCMFASNMDSNML
jgi:hypothetical protein